VGNLMKLFCGCVGLVLWAMLFFADNAFALMSFPKTDWSRSSCEGSSESKACAFITKGNEYSQRGLFDEAIVEYDRAIDVDPLLAG
jgi:tetratricopeptide (TPR) repeat protein